MDNSILMVIGACVALIWVNFFDREIYSHILEMVIWENDFIGKMNDFGKREVDIHFLVNDFLMALFFALACKEIHDAIFSENGSLRGKGALLPVFSTFGGILGPVSVFFIGIYFLGDFTEAAKGWAIPTATDVAFSYMIARFIFGTSYHPAIAFLLVLAIVDDAIGLVIVAVFYPAGELSLYWLFLSIGSAIFSYAAFNWGPRYIDSLNGKLGCFRWVSDKLSFWPYIPMTLISWYGFHKSGIHPALGFFPVVWAMPHRGFDNLRLLKSGKINGKDVITKFEHFVDDAVKFVLCAFAFVNSGVKFSHVNSFTFVLFLSLALGKPLGIYTFGVAASKILKVSLPVGMSKSDLLVVGCIAGMGFSVSLFIASIAFNPGSMQSAAKMGALLSFFSALTAYAAYRISLRGQRN